MRLLSIALAAISLLILASPAHANWSLGTNLGVTLADPENTDDNLTLIAWPGSAFFLQPGLRVGFRGTNTPHEFYADTGFWDFDGNLSTLILTGNYQYNFASKSSTNFYLTGGLGFVNSSVDAGPESFGATSLMVGAGAGAGFRVADGHGRIRAELRYDRVTEGDDNGVVVIDESGLVGFKFGFDLWMK